MARYIKVDRALFDSVVYLLGTFAASDKLDAETVIYFRDLSVKLRACDTPGLRGMVKDIEHNREMQGVHIASATEMANRSRDSDGIDSKLESLHFMVSELAKAHSAGFRAQFPDISEAVEEQMLDHVIRHRAEQDTSPKN